MSGTSDGAERIAERAAERDALARLVAFGAKMPMKDGRATAYVCRDYACRLPVHEPAEMAALLEE